MGRQLAVILASICESCQLLFNNPQPTVSSQRLVILYSNSAIRLLSASPCQPVAAPDRPDSSACGCDQQLYQSLCPFNLPAYSQLRSPHSVRPIAESCMPMCCQCGKIPYTSAGACSAWTPCYALHVMLRLSPHLVP